MANPSLTIDRPGLAGRPLDPLPLGSWAAPLAGLLAVALGVGLGLLAAYDPAWAVYHPLWSIFAPSGLRSAALWTGTAVAVLAVLMVLARRAAWLFERRDAFIIIIVLSSAALTGINIGSRDPFEMAFVLAFTYFWVVTTTEHRPIVLPPVVVVLLSGLGLCAIASMIRGRVPTFFGLPALLSKYVMMILIINFLHSRRLLKTALRTFLIVAALSAVVAILSQLLFVTTGYELTFDDSPEIHHKDTPLGRMLRATAFLPATQTLGHLLIPALALAMLMPCGPIARVLLAGLLLVGTGVTFSTGSIISAAAVVVLGLFVRRPQHSIHYLTLFAIAGLVAYFTGLIDKVYNAFVVTGSFGLTERVELFKGGLELVERHPLLGMGIQNTTRVLHLQVHNAYVQMASEAGILAGVFFTSLVVYVTVICAASAGTAPQPDDRLWLKGLAVGMVGHLIHLSATPLAAEYVSFAYMGLALSAVRLYGRSRPLPGVSA